MTQPPATPRAEESAGILGPWQATETLGTNWAGIAAFGGAALAMIIGSLLKPPGPPTPPPPPRGFEAVREGDQR